MKAVIAQSDVVTAYGWGIDALWDGLLSGKTAIKPSERFAKHEFVSNQAAEILDLEVSPGQSRSRAMLDRLLAPIAGKLDPKTTLILATTVCEIEFVERAIAEGRPQVAHKADPQLLLAHLKQVLGLRGSAMVLSSACASSSAALTQAASMIQRGESSTVLVVACDAISEFVYSGFSTLLSLCDTPARPFDANRCGLSLGEAAAWALITPDHSPLANSRSLSILGWCNTTDAVHMTAPDRAASGLSRAIICACEMAAVTTEAIACVAAHGTATIYNDAMELLAFHNVLQTPVPVFSIKGGIGHTLGAAGLTQILVAARATQLGVIPPTVGLYTPDSYAEGWAFSTPRDMGDRRIALSTNSGFGGVNTAILLGSNTSTSAGYKKSASLNAIGWFSAENCGWISGYKPSSIQSAPALSSTREMLALIDRPAKYFARMTTEARSGLAAAGLALSATGWSKGPVGIISAGYDGCITADQEYFRDYVAGGSSLGRGNLFIYTLPTSALSEVAIALTLTGPTLHMHEDHHPIQSLVSHAAHLVSNNEAHGMLALFTDGEFSICFAIGQGQPIEVPTHLEWHQTAAQMCASLADTVKRR